MPRRFNLTQSLMLTPVLILYGLAAATPILMIAQLSFKKGLGTFGDLFASPIFLRIAQNTLVISLETTLVAVLLAYAIAALLAQSGERARAWIMAAILLPFWTAALIKNFAWSALLQDNGVINLALIHLGIVSHPLPLLHTRLAVVIGMVHYVIPYAVFPIYSSMLAIDPRLYRAAKSLGAPGWRTVVSVTLPLTRPGLYAGGLLVFIICLGFYITPVLLGSPREMMVANLVDFYTHQIIDFPMASALALVILIATAFLIALYHSIPKEGQYGKI
ncbi:ABC transporter permease [Caballeronia sp. LZ035]|uniref:ABC transporter permease n=1 Tax=Caballeronia sp. LZ035 TaxID=3038568 RepID=UPI00285956D1|nr:ABC transporter permease [Caballeronia sp. LZ035]MDR5758820.1 ABC transporter permease [Caballeronia sp. LZ035]